MDKRSSTMLALIVLLGAFGLAGPVVAASALEPGGTFTDDDESVHEGAIESIREAGLTVGCNPPTSDRFCPERPVTRQEMASFLVRALGLPDTTTDFFDDDSTSVHQSAINALAAAGITFGCNPPTNDAFCPTAVVTRAQIASFIVRGFGLPLSTVDFFGDDSASVHEADINSLAAAALTAGCNPPSGGAYCPEDPVTREEMASFLQRALGLPFLDVPDPLPGNSPSPLVVIGDNKWLYYRPAIDQDCVSPATHADAAAEIGRVRELVEASGRDFYFVVVPDKASVYPEFIPPEIEANSCRSSNSVNLQAALAADLTANPITMWDLFGDEADTGPVYFRHDTHWNGKGSLAGAEHIAGIMAESTWSAAVPVEVSSARRGDLAAFIGVEWIEDFTDYSVELAGAATTVTAEALTYNGRPIVTFETSGPIDPRSIAVFHDSFGYLLRNKLGSLFSKVTFIPAYTFPGDDVSLLMLDTDVIVVTIVERNATSELTSGNLLAFLREMLTP